jgi:polygalacturonase
VSGDDGISIKSGRDEAGRSVGRPTEDLVLMDNVIVKASAGGVAVGSEVSGAV